MRSEAAILGDAGTEWSTFGREWRLRCKGTHEEGGRVQDMSRGPGSLHPPICLQCRRPGFEAWVRKIPWRRDLPAFLLEKFHGQRSLSGYSPRDCKESDTTEQLTYVI